MTKIQGIYSILHIESGRVYIGSSRNIKKRFSAHKTDLKYNKHPNPVLQNYYNKYGLDAFMFSEIFSIYDCSILIDIENEIIAQINETDVFGNLDYNKLFNTQWANKTGCVDPTKYKRGEDHHLYGTVGHNKGKIFSAETRKNMSAGQKGKRGSQTGISKSDEIKQKLRDKMKGKPWTQTRRDAQNAKD